MANLPLSRIRFDAPSDWSDLSSITLVAPEGEEFRANILVTHEAFDGDDVAEYATLQLESLSGEVEEYAEVRRENQQAAGKPALTVEHTFLDSEAGLNIRQLQLFLLADGIAYTLSVTHLDDVFDEVRPAFHAAVASLKVS